MRDERSEGAATRGSLRGSPLRPSRARNRAQCRRLKLPTTGTPSPSDLAGTSVGHCKRRAIARHKQCRSEVRRRLLRSRAVAKRTNKNEATPRERSEPSRLPFQLSLKKSAKKKAKKKHGGATSEQATTQGSTERAHTANTNNRHNSARAITSPRSGISLTFVGGIKRAHTTNTKNRHNSARA